MGSDDVTVSSVSELSHRLDERDFNHVDGIWFRGESDFSWALKPKLDRSEIRSHEKELLNEFEIQASGILQRAIPESWEVLCVAQHFGLPTRMLDWTTLSLIALYFATLDDAEVDPSADTDGAVYVLSPSKFNHTTIEVAHPLLFGRDALPDKDLSIAYAHGSEEPYAVSAPFTFDRIQSQEGRFVVCPPGGRAVELYMATGIFEKWRVPADAKAGIRSELKMLGMTKARVFPTLDHVAQLLVERYSV